MFYWNLNHMHIQSFFLFLRLLDQSQYPHLNTSQTLSLFTDNFLQFHDFFSNQRDLPVIELNCFFGTTLYKETSSILDSIHPTTLHIYTNTPTLFDSAPWIYKEFDNGINNSTSSWHYSTALIDLLPYSYFYNANRSCPIDCPRVVISF